MHPIMLFAGVLLMIYGVAALGGGAMAGSTARRQASRPVGGGLAVLGLVLTVTAIYLIVQG